jgi:hypothetical protein
VNHDGVAVNSLAVDCMGSAQIFCKTAVRPWPVRLLAARLGEPVCTDELIIFFLVLAEVLSQEYKSARAFD